MSRSVILGERATFTVTASGSNLTYQWRRNNIPISGAQFASYTAPPADPVDQGAAFTVEIRGDGGIVVSSGALLTLHLSTNQQIAESVIRSSDGSFALAWNLNYSGAQATDTNYWVSTNAPMLAQSPLFGGPQRVVDSPWVNMTASLATPTLAPTRILKDGSILVIPSASTAYKISYVGADVRVDTLASDGFTVGHSQLRTAYKAVPLLGLLAASPAEFAKYHNSIFSNPAILNSVAAYTKDAAYISFTATTIGDRYNVFDCAEATLGSNVTPCMSGTTLEDALTAGITSASDGTVYLLGEGALRYSGGVKVWIAAAPRPIAATLSLVPQYRMYFEINGNIYTGSLTPDGSLASSSYYVSNPSGATVLDRLTFLPYSIRMNRAARDSLAAGTTL